MKKILQTITTTWHKKALPCYVISRVPLIMVCYWQDFFNHKEAFAAHCTTDQPVYLIAMLGWQRETPLRAAELAAEVHAVAELAPSIRITFLSNSPVEERLITGAGLTSVFCHQNAFLDERRYRVVPAMRKQYDAIYVARITPFKRHQLASGISSLSLIGSWHDYERQHRDAVMQALPAAHWQKKAWAPRMYRHMNAAHTGLCLSAEEGAMFVSAEYLLCGLPVVSTPNIGGRDHLFTEPFAVTVSPSPQAVAEGVAWQIGQRHDPQDIRHAVIEKMQYHRSVFRKLVQSIYDAEGLDRDFADEWPAVYTHKLGIRCRMPWSKRRQQSLHVLPPLGYADGADSPRGINV